MTPDDIRDWILEAPREELPARIGVLAAAHAEALALLAVQSAPPTSAVDRLLPMRDVAERLGISLYTARKRGRAGKLPVVKVGHHTGVRESSLRRYLDASEHGGA